MPKMKTNRGAAKRFSKTASGKIKFKRAKMRHNTSNKTTAFKRDRRKTGYIAAVEQHLIEALIPYK